MAKEILVLGGQPTVRCLFLYLIPVADRVTYTDGAGLTQAVVPNPAPIEGELFDLLTTAEKAALDAGQAGYETVTFQIDATLSGAQNLAAVRAIYEDRKAKWLAAYANQWDRYGQRFDAT